MDFELTSEHRTLRSTARRFAETEIIPRASELDLKEEYLEEILKGLAKLKMMGVAVPKEYGGGGLDKVSYVLALIEVSKASPSLGAIMSANNSLYCSPLMVYGTHEQKLKYLRRCASGERMGCYGFHEKDTDLDPATMGAIAVKDGNEWLINGAKRFKANGRALDYCIVAAVTDQGKGEKGISSILVDLENIPGSERNMRGKTGVLAPGTVELILKEARVPSDALLGNEGEGVKQWLATLGDTRIGMAAQSVGVGRAILEEALDYARNKQQTGKPIAAFQSVQWKLADMATELDAAELMALRAAWLEDNTKSFKKEAAMAKLYASDVAMRASIEGVQILGEDGYIKAYPMERRMRDAKLCQIYHETNERIRLVIASNLTEGR